MKKLDEVTIAWGAGLFDGEGTIGIHGHRVQVSVAMTDLDLLERMQRAFGGSVYPLKKRQEHWKDAWKWMITSTENSLKFLELIHKYLGLRRQAKVGEARLAAFGLKSNKYARIKDEITALSKDNLTQQQIADKVGCTREHVNKTLRKMELLA